jgi:hypothetical protein
VFAVATQIAGCDAGVPGRGVLLGVDTLDPRYGLTSAAPAALLDGPDGSLYLLDQGGGTLLRLRPDGAVDTVARPGSGPGELKGPSALAWFFDSLVIVDAGNARIQLLRAPGPGAGPGRTIPFARGAADIAVDEASRTLYAVTYGQNFGLIGGRPVVRESSLVSAISLDDGQVVRSFGTPRRYDGVVVPILGNIVSIARDPDGGNVWLAWPLEPILARFGPEGNPGTAVEWGLGFTPPPPREYRRTGSPIPSAEYQQVVYDLAVDVRGRLMLLVASGPSHGRPGSQEYRPPSQALEIRRGDGTLACRLDLPIFATAFSPSQANRDELLFADAFDVAGAYRVRFHCPAS